MSNTTIVVGDVVTLGNTFKVASVNTDPTTVSLAVTDPAGTTTTYTYAGSTITKTATGSYSKDLTVNAAGTWEYQWTGTGTAADVADGSFEVWSQLQTPTTDIISLGEAKQELNIDLDDTTRDRELARVVTAVSQLIVDLCGPVVNVTRTDEAYDGGGHILFLRSAPAAKSVTLTVLAVKEYRSTTLVSLTAETAGTAPADGYLVVGELGQLVRRVGGYDHAFYPGRRNILVTYTVGRAATTALVPAKIKEAAKITVAHMWRSAQGFGALSDEVTFGPSFSLPKRARELLLDEVRAPSVA